MKDQKIRAGWRYTTKPEDGKINIGLNVDGKVLEVEMNLTDAGNLGKSLAKDCAPATKEEPEKDPNPEEDSDPEIEI